MAAYYAPEPGDPLHHAGSAWLGRDVDSNAPVRRPNVPGLEELARDPRRYGFHATLKPPMRLRSGTAWAEFAAAVRQLAGSIAPFPLPRLRLATPHGFLALQEATPCPALQRLADRCVEALDPFRAPPDAAEAARRRQPGLSPLEAQMVERWGYPYVFETWFFHMTLTRRLADAELGPALRAAGDHFAEALARPRMVSDICIFAQPHPGAEFVVAWREKLSGSAR